MSVFRIRRPGAAICLAALLLAALVPGAALVLHALAPVAWVSTLVLAVTFVRTSAVLGVPLDSPVSRAHGLRAPPRPLPFGRS